MIKKIFNGIYGIIMMFGFVSIVSCDTDTPTQLLIVIIIGFAAIAYGGYGLIKNNSDLY